MFETVRRESQINVNELRVCPGNGMELWSAQETGVDEGRALVRLCTSQVPPGELSQKVEVCVTRALGCPGGECLCPLVLIISR